MDKKPGKFDALLVGPTQLSFINEPIDFVVEPVVVESKRPKLRLVVNNERKGEKEVAS
jgi:hypothetical protein